MSTFPLGDAAARAAAKADGTGDLEARLLELKAQYQRAATVGTAAGSAASTSKKRSLQSDDSAEADDELREVKARDSRVHNKKSKMFDMDAIHDVLVQAIHESGGACHVDTLTQVVAQRVLSLPASSGEDPAAVKTEGAAQAGVDGAATPAPQQHFEVLKKAILEHLTTRTASNIAMVAGTGAGAGLNVEALVFESDPARIGFFKLRQPLPYPQSLSSPSTAPMPLSPQTHTAHHVASPDMHLSAEGVDGDSDAASSRKRKQRTSSGGSPSPPATDLSDPTTAGMTALSQFASSTVATATALRSLLDNGPTSATPLSTSSSGLGSAKHSVAPTTTAIITPGQLGRAISAAAMALDIRPPAGTACAQCGLAASSSWFRGPTVDEWYCQRCGEEWSREHACPVCGLVYEDDVDGDVDADADIDVDDGLAEKPQQQAIIVENVHSHRPQRYTKQHYADDDDEDNEDDEDDEDDKMDIVMGGSPRTRQTSTSTASLLLTSAASLSFNAARGSAVATATTTTATTTAAVDSAPSPWIACDECGRWVMTKCDGITDLSVYDDDNPNHLHYSCPLCRGERDSLPRVFFTKQSAPLFRELYLGSGQLPTHHRNSASSSSSSTGSHQHHHQSSSRTRHHNHNHHNSTNSDYDYTSDSSLPPAPSSNKRSRRGKSASSSATTTKASSAHHGSSGTHSAGHDSAFAASMGSHASAGFGAGGGSATSPDLHVSPPGGAASAGRRNNLGGSSGGTNVTHCAAAAPTHLGDLMDDATEVHSGGSVHGGGAAGGAGGFAGVHSNALAPPADQRDELLSNLHRSEKELLKSFADKFAQYENDDRLTNKLASDSLRQLEKRFMEDVAALRELLSGALTALLDRNLAEFDRQYRRLREDKEEWDRRAEKELRAQLEAYVNFKADQVQSAVASLLADDQQRHHQQQQHASGTSHNNAPAATHNNIDAMQISDPHA